MALNDHNTGDLAFKNLRGFAHTSSSKEIQNESERSFANIQRRHVWMSEISSNPDNAVSGCIAEYVCAELVADPTSNGQAFFAVYPSGHLREGERISGCISPMYGDGYQATLYAGAIAISVNDPRDWVFQYDAGVLFQQTANASPTPTSVCVYVYIGETLALTGATASPVTYVTRTIPSSNTGFNTVEVGNWKMGNGSHNFVVGIEVSGDGYSVSKQYHFVVQYNQTTGIWYTALPAVSTGPYLGNDFDLDVSVAAEVLSLKLRRSGGTEGGGAYICFVNIGSQHDVFTEEVDYANDAAPTNYFPAGNNAPYNASYVTLATNPNLSSERVLTGTANRVLITDNGPKGTVVLSTPQDIDTAATPTFAGLTLTGDFTGTNGHFTGDLVVDGTLTATSIIGTFLAPGSDTWVLFNDGGDVGADSGFTYDKTTDALTIAGSLLVGTTSIFTVAPIQAYANSDAWSGVGIKNASAGTSAAAALALFNNTNDTFSLAMTSVANAANARVALLSSSSGRPIVFAAGGVSEQSRFETSGNLLIGTTDDSLSARIYAYHASAQGAIYARSGATGSFGSLNAINSDGLNTLIQQKGSAVGGTIAGISANNVGLLWSNTTSAMVIDAFTNVPLVFAQNDTERARFAVTTGNLLIGTTTDAGSHYPLQIVRDQNTYSVARLQNNTVGGTAQAYLSVANSTHDVEVGITSTGWTTSGIFAADTGYVYSGGNGGLVVTSASAPILFSVNGGSSEHGRFAATTGNLLIGTAIDNGTGYLGQFLKNHNGATRVLVQNGNATVSGASQALFEATNDLGNNAQLGIVSSTYAASGAISAGDAYVQGNGTALLIRTIGSNAIRFAPNNVEAMRLVPSTGNLLIGTTTDASSASPLQVRRDQNANTFIRVANGTANTGAAASFQAFNDAGSGHGTGIFSSAFTSSGALVASASYLYGDGVGGVSIIANNASGIIRFAAGGITPQWQINTAGHLLASTDNTYDIGATGATRPRNIYVAGALSAATGTFSGTVTYSSLIPEIWDDGANTIHRLVNTLGAIRIDRAVSSSGRSFSPSYNTDFALHSDGTVYIGGYAFGSGTPSLTISPNGGTVTAAAAFVAGAISGTTGTFTGTVITGSLLYVGNGLDSQVLAGDGLGTGQAALRLGYDGTVNLYRSGLGGVTGGFVMQPSTGASSSGLNLIGTWFTGGTSATTKPHLLVEPVGITSTGWSTSGTGIGVNAVSTFTGNLLDLKLNGTTKASVDASGNFTTAGTITVTTVSNSAGLLPQWIKVTIPYTSFSTAATTNTISGYTLPAGGIIHGIKVKHSTAFSGTSITGYTIKVGISGETDRYTSAFSVFSTVSGTNFQLNSTFDSQDHGSTTDIKVTATSTGANLSAATAGSVDIWLLVSTAV
jgi:hypothetical protein